MTHARRLAALERLAPAAPPATDDDARRAERILALFRGDPLPDGMPATDHERRAAAVLTAMAAGRRYLAAARAAEDGDA